VGSAPGRVLDIFSPVRDDWKYLPYGERSRNLLSSPVLWGRWVEDPEGVKI
jgi:hypothetical protein